MPSTAAQAALSPTMSKAEVCEFLGKSKRTVETYISTGRLKIGYFQGPNGKTGIFERADVEALKREIDTPSYRAVLPIALSRGDHGQVYADIPHDGRSTALATAHDPFAGLAAHLARLATAFPTPQRVKPWLTLDEAAKYSGLPKAWLIRQTQTAFRPDGQPNVARNFGSEKRAAWRFNRDLLRTLKRA